MLFGIKPFNYNNNTTISIYTAAHSSVQFSLFSASKIGKTGNDETNEIRCVK